MDLHHRDWDEHLPLLLIAYGSTVRDANEDHFWQRTKTFLRFGIRNTYPEKEYHRN